MWPRCRESRHCFVRVRRAAKRGWWLEKLACGHDVMFDMPEELAALLLQQA